MLHHLLTLAQSDERQPWEIMRDSMRTWNSETDQVGRANSLMLLLAIIAAAFSVLYIIRAIQRRQTAPKPSAMFRQLVGELGLGMRDQWLLARISQARNLPNPLTLLISRGTLEHHGSAYAESLTGAAQQRAMARIRSIASNVFGD